MENSTTWHTCTFDLNYSCWKRLATEQNREYSDQMTPVIVMMILFQVVGIPGNTVVLVMYCTKRQRSTAQIFITFLAGIDLFACVVIHPYIVYKLYSYFDQIWTVVCKIFEFLVHLNLVMSGLTLLLVAIDRYLAICKPVKFLHFDRHIVKGIVSITTLSVTVSLPLLEFYGPNPNSYQIDEIIFVSYRCDYQPRYQGSVFYTAFSAFIMLGFITEIVAMTILYKNVAHVAYRSRNAVFPLSNAHIFAGLEPANSVSGPTNSISTKSQTTSKTSDMSSSPTQVPWAVASIYNQLRSTRAPQVTSQQHNLEMFNVQTTSKTTSKTVGLIKKTRSSPPRQTTRRNLKTQPLNNSQTNANRFRNRLKAAKMLFFVTFVFFLSWMPFFILRVCYTLNPAACRMDSYVGRIIDNIINHVFYINNAINPILYTILNQSFRSDFYAMVKKKCRCSKN